MGFKCDNKFCCGVPTASDWVRAAAGDMAAGYISDAVEKYRKAGVLYTDKRAEACEGAAFGASLTAPEMRILRRVLVREEARLREAAYTAPTIGKHEVNRQTANALAGIINKMPE